MNKFKLIIKSILFYWKITLSSTLATALCVAIIAGALIIGDSVKYSLNQIAEQRLGKTAYIVNAGDKLFTQQLAKSLSVDLHVNTSSLLQANGMASKNGGQLAVNNVHINGIDSLFMNFAPSEVYIEPLQYDEVYINAKLAQKLELDSGDFVLLKIQKHDDVPLNSPFVSTERRFVSLFATVKGVLSDAEFGRFSLQNDQVSPFNVYLRIDQLNEVIEQQQSANIILVQNENNLDVIKIQNSLKEVWNQEDASIAIHKTKKGNQFEIQSDQIFIDSVLIHKTKKLFDSTDLIFTYLVNSIDFQEKSTPYSFVSSLESLELSNNEIIVNTWLANDLGISFNDTVTLKYYVVGPLRSLKEESKTFVVKAITAIEGYAADSTLMPRFPGLANVDNCRDWNTAINIDLDKIRDKDELYWDNYRGIPKAFVSNETAKEMWANEFGEATAIRFSTNLKNSDESGSKLLNALLPSDMGLQTIPVKEQGRLAANNSVDFSQLFLGMSFFIVAAALLLIILFFHLNTEYRNKEMGFYLTAGFTKKSIKQLWLTEGLIVVIVGGIIGLAGAVLYNKLLLNAINTIWLDMVKTSILYIRVNPASLAIGYSSGIFCALLTLYFTVKNKFKKNIVDLQKNTGLTNDIHSRPKVKRNKTVFYSGVFGMVILTSLYFLKLMPDSSLVFFLSGMLLLISGISGFNLILNGKSFSLNINNLSFFRLCLTNLSRNKKRSILIVSMLAIGVYLVISTGANRQYMLVDADNPKSGTGGFLFYTETTLPIIDDLNTYTNKIKYGIEQSDSFNVEIVQCKTLEGDEASCFNLNQIKQPRLLGIDVNALATKNAFTFAKTLQNIDNHDTWKVLNTKLGKNTYPVIADQTVIQWSFGKKLGDTLYYQKQNGDTINLVLVAGLQNSIFQGNALISDSVFRAIFPVEPGSKVFLIDGNPQYKEEIKQLFNRNLRDYGIEVTDAAERLVSFYSVQNTYLNVFVLLGGIGLIIGTLGIGILIFRTVLERKHELAILRAMGYKKLSIFRMLIIENSFLLLAGILIGVIAAVVSTLPSFIDSGTQIPILLILKIMITLMVFGLGIVFLSVTLSTRRSVIAVLKSE